MALTQEKNKHLLALIPGTKLFGSERGNIEALRVLKASGINVTIALSNRIPGGGDVGQHVRALGFNVVYFPYGSHFKKEWLLHDFGYARRQLSRLFINSNLLIQTVKKIKVTDVWISKTHAYLFVALALLVSRVPVIFRMGDTPNNDSKFHFFLWYRLSSRATKIVGISDYITGLAVENNPTVVNKIRTIRSAVVSRDFPVDERLIDELQSTKRPFQLVFVGQLTKQKGVEQLIEALIELDNPRIGCWIVGGSVHTNNYESMLKRKALHAPSSTVIEFFGYQDDPRPYYHAADWHIVTSQYLESLGNVVQEAKECETPSIVTPCGGLPELIRHEEDGLILQNTTSQAIYAGIKQAMGMQSSSWHLGQNAKDSLEQLLSRQAFTQAWLDMVASPEQ